MKGKEPESVLVLTFARRGEAAEVREALRHLGSELPGARMAAVGTPASAPALRELGLSDVIVYGEGRGVREVLREARGRKPRAAGIVYGGPGLSGHLKLELVALGSGARRVYRFRAGEPARVVGRLGLLGSACGKALGLGIRGIAGCAMCAVALCWLRLRQMTAGGRGAGRD